MAVKHDVCVIHLDDARCVLWPTTAMRKVCMVHLDNARWGYGLDIWLKGCVSIYDYDGGMGSTVCGCLGAA